MRPFKRCLLFAILFSGYILQSPAQEMDMYRDLLKESIDTNIIPELKTKNPNFNPSLGPMVWDADKKAFLHVGYNYNLNTLISTFPETTPDRNFTVSSYVTIPYTNQEGFDPTSTDSAIDVIANGILTPLAAIGTFNIFVLAQYLMNVGAIPSEPFVPKESKKSKRLREIKSIYNID